MQKRRGRRGDLEWDTLIAWMIGILVLVLSLVLYLTLSGKGQQALDALKNLLRFR